MIQKSMGKKKILLTIVSAAVVLAALGWVFWLVFYYDATLNGPVVVDFSNDYIRFEHDYLVPIQIFGITAVLSVLAFWLYSRFRKKKVIGRKYIILLALSTLPFWYLSVCHLHSIITH